MIPMRSEAMAQILSEAQPYIQKYRGKTVVVKYGGNAMTSNLLKSAVMSDLVMLTLFGIRVVLVHGGGPEINKMLAKIGKEPKFIGGLRYTDEETMDVVQSILAGKVNKDLVALLKTKNGKAMGLCGMDDGMLQCKKITGGVDLGLVGEITHVDTTLIETALNGGYIPVIATVGVDKEGQAYNVNADTAASFIAIALDAAKLVSMTDVAGLLRDKDDEETLIAEVQTDSVNGLVEAGIIAGGMIPKIQSCVDAIKGGVREAVIIDGRISHSILLETFSDRGSGTLFY